MFFSCELQKLRQLKTYLLASARCEKILNSLPGQLESRIENCPELAELKAAEENLKIQKEWDANNRKKRTRTATVVAAFVSLAVTIAAALLLSLPAIPTILMIVGGTLVLTVIIHLIAKSAIRNGRAKNQDKITACEEELTFANAAFESAKQLIETELQEEIAQYEKRLEQLKAAIKNSDVVHDSDKNYNTVCQIIWCIEHKYAYGIISAKQWIARANHSKYVRGKLDQISLNPQDEADIDLNATEGKDYSAEIPQATEAEA